MTNRPVLFVFSAVLLFLSGPGCKKKEVPAASFSPNPRSRATPVAQAQPSPQSIAKPVVAQVDLATAIPLKTFQVKPPASFGSDQFREPGVFEFRVSGSAGQVLQMKLDQGWYNDLVKPLEGAFDTMIPGGDQLGNRLYVLPQTGVYRVVVQRGEIKDSPSTSQAIQFALLNLGDPPVDPGIRAEQISGDFREFAPHAKWTLVPYSHFEGEVGDFWPSHLALQYGQFEFRVMPIAGYRRIVGTQDIETLQSVLRANGAGADPKKFPYSGYQDAALMLATRPKLIHGVGWRGLRWIGEYAQDSGCGFTDFTYIFEGVTDDGRFFAMMQAPVKNANAIKNLNTRCDAAFAGNFEAFYEKQMPALFDKELSNAAPASFEPNLDRLDAAIQTLKIN